MKSICGRFINFIYVIIFSIPLCLELRLISVRIALIFMLTFMGFHLLFLLSLCHLWSIPFFILLYFMVILHLLHVDCLNVTHLLVPPPTCSISYHNALFLLLSIILTKLHCQLNKAHLLLYHTSDDWKLPLICFDILIR